MQLASYGTRAIPARHLSRLIPHTPNPGINLGSRSIHIPLPRPTASSIGTAQKVFQTTRTLVSRFFAHLTAPGLRAPPTSFPTTARSLHTASRSGIEGIRANLSLPTRHALSRGPFLPRPPVVPRAVTQVGLGTARNFSSARPIFQNLAQNVPVTGRAFLEADWEIKGYRDDAIKIGLYAEKENKQESKEMMKPLRDSIPLSIDSVTETESEADAELDHYFPAINSHVAPVTTYLLIPLAPTPTTRLPLNDLHKGERLLPLPQLSAIHATHSTHALRVSTLFARLDAGDVWDQGVKCDAYSSGPQHRRGADGVCTVLRVAFEGWTGPEVRSVIGESGTGWCELIEVRNDENDEELYSLTDDEAAESDMGDPSPLLGPEIQDGLEQVDPSQSFVLPTLDFSSSFLATSPVVSPPPLSPTHSDFGFDFLSPPSHSDTLSDAGSDGSSDGASSTFSDLSSGESWVQATGNGASRFGFGFSSGFVSRFEDSEGPREAMF